MENAPDSVTVFTGDLFGGRGKILNVTSKLIIDTLPMMDIDALALGEQDLTVEYDQFLSLAINSSVPFICANMDQEGVKPYTVVNRSGKKVLITGALDPKLLTEAQKAAFHLSAPVESIKKILDTVEHDISIVVLHFDRKNTADNLRAFQSVDLLLYGHTVETGCNQKVANPVTQKDIITAANNTGGRDMACVDLDFSGPAPTIADYKILYLDDQVAYHEEVFNLVDTREKQFSTAVKAEAEFGRFKFMNVKSYAGYEWCVACHQDIVDSWKETPHAKAMLTLEKKGKDQDPQCIKCHVTGYMSSDGFNGFIRRDVTPELENVQCEACHGPASNHLLDAKNSFGIAPSETTCRSCHTNERDPDFDFNNDVMRGSHVHIIQ